MSGTQFLINIQHTDTGQQLRIMFHHIVTTIVYGPLGEGLALSSLVSLLFLSFVFLSYYQFFIFVSFYLLLYQKTVYFDWDQCIPKTPPSLKAFQDAIFPAVSCYLKPTKRSFSDAASNEDKSLPQSRDFAADFDWSSDLSSPSFVNIEDILTEVEDRHGRSSKHMLLCQRMQENLPQSSALSKIIGCC